MSLRRFALPLLAVSAFAFAACGEDVAEVQQQVDEAQEQVDRVQDAVQDPVGAVEEEAQRQLKEALTPEAE